MNINPCLTCKIEYIKETVGCNIDKSNNNLEDLKYEILCSMGFKYTPKYQCRFDYLKGDIEE